MIIHNCPQGSDEWFAVRLGKVTSSCFSKAIAGGAGKTADAYMYQLIAERMAGESQDGYTNPAMQWGTDTEPLAREYYEALNGCSVQEVGFAELNEDIGSSTDGFVGDDGIIEIKCPNSTTHIKNMVAGKMPPEYKAQVQGGLWVTGRKWCDFVSYDPRITEAPYFCERIGRDEKYIQELSGKIDAFIVKMKETISKITGKSPF